MVRKQFTFYYSFFEALSKMDDIDRLASYDAIVAYALLGEEPDFETPMQAVAFTMARPNLDAARKKAAKAKARNAEPKSKGSHKGKKESELESKLKLESELESQTESESEFEGNGMGPCPSAFTDFWNLYPCKLSERKARQAYAALAPDEQTQRQILEAVEAWKRSARWAEEGGRYIPNGARFLEEGYYLQKPEPAKPVQGTIYGCSGELGQAELEAIRNVMAMG